MNGNWIKINRSILKWEWYDDPNTFRVFFHILINANYEDKKWHGYEIKRGQWITSLKKLSGQLGLSVRQVRTALEHLKSTHEIATTSTNGFTLITVENYSKYQDVPDGIDKQSTHEATNERQTSDKRATTTKEYKEIKNIKNRRIVIDGEEIDKDEIIQAHLNKRM